MSALPVALDLAARDHCWALGEVIDTVADHHLDPRRRMSPRSNSKRLIVREHDLLIVPIWPIMRVAHPSIDRVLDAGVVLAELTSFSDVEAGVAFAPRARVDADVQGRIASWAELVGYRRIWFPETVRELDPAARAIGPAEVDCLGCGVTLHGSGYEFWLATRERKTFPPLCPVCGFTLPQWRVTDAEPLAAHEGAEVCHGR